MHDLTWADVGVAALFVLGSIALLLIWVGWGENRRDAALGLNPPYYRPIRLRPWR